MNLVFMVTDRSGEPSFSTMEFIKNILCTIMSIERLSHLAFMTIEHDILREIDFYQIIKDYARVTSQNVWSVNICTMLYPCYD